MSFTCVTQIMRHCRTIYLAYPIWNAVRTKLSWTHYLREDDPTPTLPLPGEGVREWRVLVPPPGKGEVRLGSILRSRIWAMLEIRKSAYGQALGVNA